MGRKVQITKFFSVIYRKLPFGPRNRDEDSGAQSNSDTLTF